MGRKNNRKKRKEYKPIVTQHKGNFEVTRSGMGFVIVQGLEKDIIIKPNDFNRAFHGDLVRVEITKGDLRVGRLQGRITQVIERKQKQFIGHIEVNRDFAFFLPETDKPIPDFFIPLYALNGAKDGQKVIAQIASWEEDDKRPRGEVVELITPEKEGDLAMKEILIQQGFSLHFPEEAVEETLRISDIISADELQTRKDLRNTLTFTIDPEE